MAPHKHILSLLSSNPQSVAPSAADRRLSWAGRAPSLSLRFHRLTPLVSTSRRGIIAFRQHPLMVSASWLLSLGTAAFYSVHIVRTGPFSIKVNYRYRFVGSFNLNWLFCCAVEAGPPIWKLESMRLWIETFCPSLYCMESSISCRGLLEIQMYWSGL